MRKITVGIIGGGLAGLMAAHLLTSEKSGSQTQMDIRVFEASDCVGGRVRTLRKFGEGLYAEGGGMLLANTDKEILDLATAMNVKILPSTVKNRFYLNGQWTEKDPSLELIMILAKEIQGLQNNGIIQNPNDWSVKDSEVLDNLDRMSIITYLVPKSGKNAEEVRTLLASCLIGLYADNLDELSALDAMRCLSQYLNCKSMFSIEGGNDRLPQAIADSLNKDQQTVFLNHPVSAVKRVGNQWEVSFKNKTDKQVFDYVVMAVPLSALQTSNPNAIKLDLPKERVTALNAVPYGQSCARVYCEVGQRFWQKEYSCDTGKAITGKPTLWIEDQTADQKNSTHGVVEAHATGKIGFTIQQSTDPGKTGEQYITSVYGESFKQQLLPEKTTTLFWGQEPFQWGSYAAFKPGQRRFPELFRKPLNGSLFFAGDYTSSKPASMNGAVASGRRVVEKELLPAIGLFSKPQGSADGTPGQKETTSPNHGM